MQAVLDGERGNVQIVGSNETPRAVLIYHGSLSRDFIDGANGRWVNPTRTASTVIISIDTHNRTLPMPLTHGILVESI